VDAASTMAYPTQRLTIEFKLYLQFEITCTLRSCAHPVSNKLHH
jgi:hypothetical protein